jgi:exodeoxyribonuclease V alpha subunit
MIAALKTQRFSTEIKLRTEYGIPQYVLDSKSEQDLIEMMSGVPKNPWRYYDSSTGFTITLCEKLAEKFLVNNEFEACKAYLQYSIDQVANQGHCYAKEWQILNILKKKNLSDYYIQKAIDFLQRTNVLFVSEKKNYFLSKYFNAEQNFANLLKEQDKRNGYPTGFYKNYSFLYEELNEAQRQVVDAIEYNSLIILTGKPGSGKTTTIRTIVDSYDSTNIRLFAPTGKAASRMTELCGIQASTLHSFFLNQFAEPLENVIIIIDELSMCDVEIAGQLQRLIGNNCVLLLIGDPDQLPSVGPGEILRNIIDSGVGLRYHLNQVLRTKPGSILNSAISISNNCNIICGPDKEVTVYHPNTWDLEKITSRLLIHPEWRDAQILCCLKEKGSQIINNVAKKIFHPNSSSNFDVDDKVIHIKNNKELEVFNGETGTVIKVNNKITIVEFKDKVVEYPNHLLWQLELAYCITVHKSQGSEYNKLIFFMQPSQVTNKNLIYTAITRAKSKLLIITPSEQSLLDGIQTKQKPRQTSLKWLLQK